MLVNVEIEKIRIKANGINKNGKKELNGDEEWEKIWANPKAYDVLKILGDEAIDDFIKGRCTPGGFGEE